MHSHPINSNRLRCQSEKWADMGTIDTECYVVVQCVLKCQRQDIDGNFKLCLDKEHKYHKVQIKV